ILLVARVFHQRDVGCMHTLAMPVLLSALSLSLRSCRCGAVAALIIAGILPLAVVDTGAVDDRDYLATFENVLTLDQLIPAANEMATHTHPRIAVSIVTHDCIALPRQSLDRMPNTLAWCDIEPLKSFLR